MGKHQKNQFAYEDYVPRQVTKTLHDYVTFKPSESGDKRPTTENIRLKIKIMKRKDYGKAQNENDPKVRYCEYCGKKFDSGMALGGHVRNHSQVYEQKKFDRRNGNPIYADLLVASEKKSRGFSSTKETGDLWNVSDAETEEEQEKLDDDSDEISTVTESKELAVDLLQNFSTWGRRSIDGVCIPDGAAEEPTNLACGESGPLEESENTNNNNCLPDHKSIAQYKNQLSDYQIPLKKRKLQCNYSPKKLKIDETAGSCSSKGKTTNLADSAVTTDYELEDLGWPRECVQIQEGEKITESGELGRPLNPNTEKITAEKKKKQMKINWSTKLRDSEIGVQSQNQISKSTGNYKCRTCFKRFPTYHALAGHKVSHNKEKNTQLSVNESTPDDDASALEKKGFASLPKLVNAKDQECEENESMAVKTTYQSNICNKTFPMRQALGGHMRSHWAGPVEALLNEVASLNEETSQSGSKVFSFDLNELPPSDDLV